MGLGEIWHLGLHTWDPSGNPSWRTIPDFWGLLPSCEPLMLRDFRRDSQSQIPRSGMWCGEGDPLPEGLLEPRDELGAPGGREARLRSRSCPAAVPRTC